MFTSAIPLADLERFGPSLRRASRALTGLPPVFADAFVRETLQRSLVSSCPPLVSVDVWMLRLLVDSVRQIPPVTEAAPTGPSTPVEAALDSLTRDLREALVMVAIERLAYGDAAFVLDISLDVLTDRLTRARDRYSEALAGRLQKPREGRPHLRLVK